MLRHYRTLPLPDQIVFRRVDDVRLTSGRLTFGGVVTLEGSRPVQAYLEVVFDAEGRSEGVARDVRIRQEGSLLMLATSEGWRVDGFDLRFASRPVTPSPGA